MRRATLPGCADSVAKLDEDQLVRNNRIGAGKFLNQHCAFGPNVESMLRAQTVKIVLQHNLPEAVIPIAGM
jgi:hypothetical protein